MSCSGNTRSIYYLFHVLIEEVQDVSLLSLCPVSFHVVIPGAPWHCTTEFIEMFHPLNFRFTPSMTISSIIYIRYILKLVFKGNVNKYCRLVISHLCSGCQILKNPFTDVYPPQHLLLFKKLLVYEWPGHKNKWVNLKRHFLLINHA